MLTDFFSFSKRYCCETRSKPLMPIFCILYVPVGRTNGFQSHRSWDRTPLSAIYQKTSYGPVGTTREFHCSRSQFRVLVLAIIVLGGRSEAYSQENTSRWFRFFIPIPEIPQRFICLNLLSSAANGRAYPIFVYTLR